MATYDAFTPARPAPTTGLLTSLLAQFVHWNERRATIKMLHALTDYELRDIGLERADIVSWSRRR